jgi:hypothetical protein
VLVLIDPIAPPDELVAGRELRVALTCPWHVRDAPELGAPETDELARSCEELDAAEADLDERPAFYPDERVLWLPEHGALVFGDSFPGGPVPDRWLPEDKTREQYSDWLAELLELPVELVLPTHGDPGGRDLLELALS